jgi:hypothetical protein
VLGPFASRFSLCLFWVNACVSFGGYWIDHGFVLCGYA